VKKSPEGELNGRRRRRRATSGSHTSGECTQDPASPRSSPRSSAKKEAGEGEEEEGKDACVRVFLCRMGWNRGRGGGRERGETCITVLFILIYNIIIIYIYR